MEVLWLYPWLFSLLFMNILANWFTNRSVGTKQTLLPICTKWGLTRFVQFLAAESPVLVLRWEDQHSQLKQV